MKSDFVFSDPWEATENAESLKEQLESELTAPHPLYGKVVKALAIRSDSDDMLVETTDGYALVHLNWCRRSRPSPEFPHTRIFDSWQDFCQQVYEPDVTSWLEENPPSDWDSLIREATEGV